MKFSIDNSAISNLCRLVFYATHEIQNGKTINKEVVINSLSHPETRELFQDIFGDGLNLNYDDEVYSKMEYALQTVVIHDEDYRIRE